MPVQLDKEQLDRDGYIVGTFDRTSGVEDCAMALATIVTQGRDLGSTIGCVDARLEARSIILQPHTECIYESPPLHYFAVASLEASASGGEVLIFDGRIAAQKFLQQFPQMADVQVKYISTVYKGRQALHTIVSNDDIYGPTLRIRMTPDCNEIVDLPSGVTEKDLYTAVDGVLFDSVVAKISLEAGKVVYINNRVTLHGQMPYCGSIRYLRVRFDDLNNSHLAL